MFNSAIIFRIDALSSSLTDIEAALEKTPWQACSPTQERSIGWVPPRGENHGVFAESIGGHWILRLKTENRKVPTDAIERKVEEKAARIEQETGRKPGKKERKELKEEAKVDLLPHAFSKYGATLVWIDPRARLLVIDTGSQHRADEIATMLVEAFPGLKLSLLDTEDNPVTCMARWLVEQEPPAEFSVGRECELKACDESKAVVRYGRHPLDTEEVQGHIQGGKMPTKLAMSWNDRVQFMLTDALQIKKIKLQDVVFDGQKNDDEDTFDADVAITTGELSRMMPALIAALGGEGRRSAGAAQ